MTSFFENLSAAIIHSGWLSTCLPEVMEFHSDSKASLKIVQERVLQSIVTLNAESAFGKQFCFSKINYYRDFKHALQANDYAFFEPFIDRIASGEKKVLVSEEITRFEPTSGSSSSTKLIPLCASLKRSFNRMLHPWVFDLYSNYPELAFGKSYWVVTPRSDTPKKTNGGIPIGFESDSNYFGNWGRVFIDKIMAVPDRISEAESLDRWRYLTLLFLLRTNNLKLISLWNPAFFPVNLRWMLKWKNELIKDLEPFPARARILKSALGKFENGDFSACMKELWPTLKLISCWTEGEAAACIGELKSWFPDIVIQSKGLLATECPVTFPLVGKKAPVLAVNSAFFEFEEGSEGIGEILPAWEVEEGKFYRMLITTFGGLYRYRLNDIVKVEGFWRNLPMLSFAGKESFISDLRGEKICSAHVAKILKNILGKLESGTFSFLAPEVPLAPEMPFSKSSGKIFPADNSFSMLVHPESSTGGISGNSKISKDPSSFATSGKPGKHTIPEKPGEPELLTSQKNPENQENQPYYCLFFSFDLLRKLSNSFSTEQIEFELESELRSNFHYNWCREVGQLSRARICVLNLPREKMLEYYFERCNQKGGYASTVKAVSLNRIKNWKNYFLEKIDTAKN
ncbi:MAG: GH3 auxin-responsive promoter family protein [Candidatus Riflebacteria bacterium]|nr:GH3 auxin-responsive promoter family protein [Candidatus Riflebacteria bacterium]